MTEYSNSILSLLLSLAVCGILFSMHRQKREAPFLAWLATWAFLAVHYVFQIGRIQGGGLRALMETGERWFFCLAMLGLFYAAREYAGQARPVSVFAGLAGMGALWALGNYFRLLPEGLDLSLGSGLISLGAAVSFWRSQRPKRSLSARMLAGVGLLFALLAPTTLFSPQMLEEFMPFGLVTGFFTLLVMAVAMVMQAYEKVEQHSEELNLMNQIGRAISSTLEAEPLLRLIHTGIQKLMDARNFYVAMFDEARNEIRFELEVENGVYLPRRSRKACRALTEHVLRTGQPLLIPGNFDAFLRENGLDLSGRPARSWCGAPLLIRGRAAGILAVQSYDREGAYDQGHLKILEAIAAQAAVAWENARLFAEDEKRVRQLTFLHDITRIAISTLNAEEMLAQIASEIQKNFAYDHIGIGLLDYQTKEVEIKAEAGGGIRTLGKRLPLEAGLIGRVARSAQLALLNDTSAEPGFTGVLPLSRSALCLPITYADQLLGVLNIESHHPGAFQQDDLPILQTLADHLATALHNAFAFKQTQEQAITDGLTGVKTHRYFMEALTGEWRRATRGGRIFSLLVLDLDHFKQINDTLGHLEGDLVLARLGRILEQNSRQSNVVARYGGDEFMVLMPEATIERARILAERLCSGVASDPMFAERHLTASFGLATFPIHGQTPEEIIRAADAGLYQSKHQGGNCVSVAEQFRQGQAERWHAHVFSSFLESLSRRLESTGPEILDSLIQRIEEAWHSFPGDPQELMRVVVDGLAALGDLLEEHAHGVKGHHRQTTRYAMLLARALNLSEEQKEQIRLAARLHDVGYLAVVPGVLDKKGKLSALEFAAVHVHPAAGARLLEVVHMAPEICEMVRCHHETVNGRGYPDGLPGEQIPLGARILTIADAFEAITSPRPYRPARSPAEALDEMDRFAGTQFDELLLRTFLRLMKKETGQEVLSPEG